MSVVDILLWESRLSPVSADTYILYLYADDSDSVSAGLSPWIPSIIIGWSSSILVGVVLLSSFLFPVIKSNVGSLTSSPEINISKSSLNLSTSSDFKDSKSFLPSLSTGILSLSMK